MYIELIEIIIFVALIFYIVFAGADYGAGILEGFSYNHPKNKHIQQIINHAIGPVWEANHIWLILIIVIFFNGFPSIYTTLTTFLHIPLIFVLFGIVLRGIAFTLRHYDVFENRPEKTYNFIFIISSVWTSMWLGITAGSLVLGKINLNATTFFEAYVAPWSNLFCLSFGLFITSVFTYLATSFLVNETHDGELATYFKKQSKLANLAVILTGGLLFSASYIENLVFLKRFFSSIFSLSMMFFATVSWLLLMLFSNQLSSFLRRVLVVCQVVFILIGFFVIQSPVIIATMGQDITMEMAAASEATLKQLFIALVAGLIIILPSLLYLFWIFKFNKKDYQA